MNVPVFDLEQQQQQQQQQRRRRQQHRPQEKEETTIAYSDNQLGKNDAVPAQCDVGESSESLPLQYALDTLPTEESSADITAAAGTTRVLSDPTEQQDQEHPQHLPENIPEKGGFVRRRCFRWYHRFANYAPRLFALVFGFMAPLLALVILAGLCGFPLALLESPLEMERNDYVLEQQMRLLVETSVYTNLTQSLPRICLSLYFLNATVDEFLTNVSTLLDGPPTKEDVADYVWDYVRQENNQSGVFHSSSSRNSTDMFNDTGVAVLADAITDVSATVAANGTGPTLTATTGSSTWSATSTVSTETNGVAATSARDAAGSNTTSPFNITIEIDPEKVQDNVEGRVRDIVKYLEDHLSEFYHYYAYRIGQIVQPANLVASTGPNETTAHINLTDLSLFVDECGDGLSPIIDKMFTSLSTTANRAVVSELEFAWNRCPAGPVIENGFDLPVSVANIYTALLSNFLPANWTQPTFSNIMREGMSNALSAQRITYRKEWEQQRRLLYVKYLNEEMRERPIGSNLDLDPAIWHRVTAFERSLKDATGGDGCVPNTPASCWFFFTVMTTIGYGNVAPESFWGKTLVFSMGFISMILFGLAATRAAYVITSIFDDLLVQLKLRVLTRPWIQVFLWGIFYYVWMVLIAYVYSWWRVERLGKGSAVSFSNAYWFSYISTTTVGFGDYFLEPEVIVGIDCFVFPVVFLLGFSILASFLTKLSKFVTRPFQDGPSLTEHFRSSDETRKSRLLLTQPQNPNGSETNGNHKAGFLF